MNPDSNTRFSASESHTTAFWPPTLVVVQLRLKLSTVSKEDIDTVKVYTHCLYMLLWSQHVRTSLLLIVPKFFYRMLVVSRIIFQCLYYFSVKQWIRYRLQLTLNYGDIDFTNNKRKKFHIQNKHGPRLTTLFLQGVDDMSHYQID